MRHDPVDVAGRTVLKPGLAGRVRQWLVDHDRDAKEVAIRQALAALGVVAEEHVLADYVRQLRAELVGAGTLQPLLERPGVTDVLVNGPGSVWVDDGCGLRREPLHLGTEADVRRLAQRLAAQAGRRLDDASPFVDARLPDGVRFHAALPPLASPGTLISLRVPAGTRFTLDSLVDAAAISRLGVAWLRSLVAIRASFLVTGGTGCGKTTLLRALLEEVPHDHRILAVEESAELEPDHPHFVRLEARPPNAEDRGRVELADLMRQAMRMRPDRIVVGEVRGREITALLNAMNTGHEGCLGTIHANDVRSLPARVEALALAGGLDRAAAHSQLAAGLDAVVHVRRRPDGRRVVAQLGVTVSGSTGLVDVVPLVTFETDRPRLHLPRHPLAGRLLAELR